jgi:hypothetical protein
MCETEIISCRVLNNKSYYHCFTANPIELVGATSLHLLSQTALPLKSPTGAFIAALRFANAVPPQTLLMVRT